MNDWSFYEINFSKLKFVSIFTISGIYSFLFPYKIKGCHLTYYHMLKRSYKNWNYLLSCCGEPSTMFTWYLKPFNFKMMKVAIIEKYQSFEKIGKSMGMGDSVTHMARLELEAAHNFCLVHALMIKSPPFFPKPYLHH